MLLQSADGSVHLIPALPDVWLTAGKVSGLRARGGFELITMEWKDGKVVKAVFKSTIGGNLRLRIPNEMKLMNGASLKKATGENRNPFYQTENTAAPLVSEQAVISLPRLKETFIYDVPTKAGQVYSFIIK